MAIKGQEKKFTLGEAFACAFKGVFMTAKERNFRIQFSVMIVAIVLGFVCSISLTEWIVVIACFGLVLGGECINSSMEAIVDLASPEFHELAGKAKDCAAGAVLLFSIASFVIGCIIFIPKLITLIFGA